jgi:hypothetical protein
VSTNVVVVDSRTTVDGGAAVVDGVVVGGDPVVEVVVSPDAQAETISIVPTRTERRRITDLRGL